MEVTTPCFETSPQLEYYTLVTGYDIITINWPQFNLEEITAEPDVAGLSFLLVMIFLVGGVNFWSGRCVH